MNYTKSFYEADLTDPNVMFQITNFNQSIKTVKYKKYSVEGKEIYDVENIGLIAFNKKKTADTKNKDILVLGMKRLVQVIDKLCKETTERNLSEIEYYQEKISELEKRVSSANEVKKETEKLVEELKEKNKEKYSGFRN